MSNKTEYVEKIEKAFELWYLYDNYSEAISKFKEAAKLTSDPEEISFCNNNIELIKRNDEADLDDRLTDYNNELGI